MRGGKEKTTARNEQGSELVVFYWYSATGQIKQGKQHPHNHIYKHTEEAETYRTLHCLLRDQDISKARNHLVLEQWFLTNPVPKDLPP